jgi:TFIIF-interacting CTD phosphatase-like protein
VRIGEESMEAVSAAATAAAVGTTAAGAAKVPVEPETDGKITLEKALDRYTEAVQATDEERNRILDRHNEIVAESQKKLKEYAQKKQLEERRREEEDREDLLTEQALIERLNARKRLESPE